MKDFAVILILDCQGFDQILRRIFFFLDAFDL